MHRFLLLTQYERNPAAFFNLLPLLLRIRAADDPRPGIQPSVSLFDFRRTQRHAKFALRQRQIAGGTGIPFAGKGFMAGDKIQRARRGKPATAAVGCS
jgi:hypothetical protein